MGKYLAAGTRQYLEKGGKEQNHKDEVFHIILLQQPENI